MDFYLKFFLVNLIAFFFTMGVDRNLLGDKLESVVFIKFILIAWFLLTLTSIPALVIYSIAIA
tara:strand:- start:481 stop:669 length:189 start_codon:yes stop_codon:yes gene_type:complete